MKQKTIIILILIVLAFVILIQNTQVVEVQIFFWKIAMSRIIMIAFMLIVGFALGYLVAMTKKK
ncbi:MAG TPA: LapA family protein [Candidatus Heimdallarchaeota archaeon]|nr:LapA family protein [Candidatus Heimdallarchaeota archaeon]